jgi:hypothetical protein
MDVWAVQKIFGTSQSFKLTILLLSLLVVSLVCNAWQYRLIKDERQHRIAIEIKKAECDTVEAEQTQVRREKKAKEIAANERMQQLYREIENLTELSGRLLIQPISQPTSPNVISSLDVTDDSP